MYDNKYTFNISLKKVSLRSGVKIETLYERVRHLKIKGVPMGNNAEKFYRLSDVNRILLLERADYHNNEKKIAIIELYLKGYSGAKIHEILNICRRYVLRCIRKYKENEGLILESKLNYTYL